MFQKSWIFFVLSIKSYLSQPEKNDLSINSNGFNENPIQQTVWKTVIQLNCHNLLPSHLSHTLRYFQKDREIFIALVLCPAREVLLKGKAQYSWPPCINQFRSAPFYIENIINLFYKTSYLNKEVNCTEPSPLISIPWSSLSTSTDSNLTILFDRKS